MAMRVCVHCKRDITYERESRNLLRDGAVGFWKDVNTQQATCPAAPVDARGQQLHDAGDVHTPPTHDPDQLEAFLNGTYVPPAPSVPCGEVYGMGDSGEFLTCGLEKGHDGDCAPGDVAAAQAAAAAVAARDTADVPGVGGVDFDLVEDGDTVTVTAELPGAVKITLEFDKSKASVPDVMQMLSLFPQAAADAIMTAVMGVPPEVLRAGREAEEQARKPEKPKPVPVDDIADIEKFLDEED